MGCEIKRVPLDFDWPLGHPWEGYVPPPDGCVECHSCRGLEGRPTGYSRLGNAIYASAEFNAKKGLLPSEAEDLTPEELRFLIALQRSVAPEYRRHNKIPYTYGGSTVTDPRMVAYDIMRHLAKTLRVSLTKTFMCPVCKGECRVVADETQHQARRRWRRKAPPKGKGWQVWETVSGGSPITPVFATPEELIEYLCTTGTTWDQESIARGWKDRLPTREEATAFVKGSGWVPSAVLSGGTMYRDIESAPLQAAE